MNKYIFAVFVFLLFGCSMENPSEKILPPNVYTYNDFSRFNSESGKNFFRDIVFCPNSTVFSEKISKKLNDSELHEGWNSFALWNDSLNLYFYPSGELHSLEIFGSEFREGSGAGKFHRLYCFDPFGNLTKSFYSEDAVFGEKWVYVQDSSENYLSESFYISFAGNVYWEAGGVEILLDQGWIDLQDLLYQHKDGNIVLEYPQDSQFFKVIEVDRSFMSINFLRSKLEYFFEGVRGVDNFLRALKNYPDVPEETSNEFKRRDDSAPVVSLENKFPSFSEANEKFEISFGE